MAPIKAIFFDFIGTCLDWHGTVTTSLPSVMTPEQLSQLALAWREAFFAQNHHLASQGQPPEDIDLTHRRTLLHLLTQEPWSAHKNLFTDTAIDTAIRSWHSMRAWPDVLPALLSLKALSPDLELFVFANGTTRLQLDLERSSSLDQGVFQMLFSSELLGVYKPAPEAYLKALKLVGAHPEESVMVAAHAYDLSAARRVGLRTVYVRRWTDDTDEDMGVVRRGNDEFLDEGMEGLRECVGRFMLEEDSRSIPKNKKI